MSEVSAEHLAKIEECADLKIRLENSEKAGVDLREEIDSLKHTIAMQVEEIGKRQQIIDKLRRHIVAVRLSMKTLFDGLAGLEK